MSFQLSVVYLSQKNLIMADELCTSVTADTLQEVK